MGVRERCSGGIDDDVLQLPAIHEKRFFSDTGTRLPHVPQKTIMTPRLASHNDLTRGLASALLELYHAASSFPFCTVHVFSYVPGCKSAFVHLGRCVELMLCAHNLHKLLQAMVFIPI